MSFPAWRLPAARLTLDFMKTRRPLTLLCELLLWLLAARRTPAQPPPEAASAFNRYTATVETRLLQQHQHPAGFLVITPADEARLHRGELILEPLSPTLQPAGALLQHWRATGFVPGATAAQLQHLLEDFRAYPQTFAPEVLSARAQPLSPNHTLATLRVRQKHALTVVMDATYDVTFGALDALDRFSASRSTQIYEIDATRHHALAPGEDHGFLWRLNTYWTYQQRPDGLILQLEAVSLSRAVPDGLGWLLRPYITSVPRESLEFTLRSAMNALHP